MRIFAAILFILGFGSTLQAQSFFEKNLDSAVSIRLNQAELKEMMFRESFRALSTVEDDSLRLYAFVEYGKFLFFTSSFDSAYAYFDRAQEHAQEDASTIARLQNMQGATLQRMEKLEAAVRHYIRAATIYEQLEDEVGIAKVYNNLSMIYQSADDWDRAEDYIRKSIAINIGLGDSVKLGQNYNNLGIIFRTQSELDSALKYFELAIVIKENYDYATSLEASSLNNLGLVLAQLKRFDEAREKFLKSIEIRRQLNDRRGELSSVLNLMDLYIELEQYDKAEKMYQDVKNYDEEFLNLEMLDRIERAAGDLYSGLGKYEEAYVHYNAALEFADSLNEQRTKEGIFELERRFRLDEKEKIIRELELKQKVDEKAQSRTQIYLIALLALVALLAGSMIVSYRRLNQNKKLSAQYLEEKKKAENTAIFKDQSLHILGHEVRTPLNGITSLAQLLKTECETTEQHEMIEMIEISATRLNRVITNVLDYAKFQAGKLEFEMEPMNIVDTCKESVKSFEVQATMAGIEIKYYGEEEEVLVPLDPQLMHSILNNLVGNAVKFTREGGTIGVHVKKGAAKVHVSVIDTGIGMAPEQLEHIFEPFEQVSEDKKSRAVGTGLGLAIVRQFSELMNAKVYAESVKGKGSTFTVSFTV